MRDRLIEILKGFRTPICEGLNAKLPDVEGLADYLLSEGVIVPPCKLGDTVYKTLITDDTKEPAIWEIVITYGDINMKAVSEKSYLIGHIKGGHCGVDIDFCEFGKTVFITREEAEKALKGN